MKVRAGEPRIYVVTIERYRTAAEIERSNDFDATGKLPCGCVICEECRAALALQNWRLERLEVAFADAELQRVVEAWNQLSTSVRAAIAILVKPGRHDERI